MMIRENAGVCSDFFGTKNAIRIETVEVLISIFYIYHYFTIDVYLRPDTFLYDSYKGKQTIGRELG